MTLAQTATFIGINVDDVRPHARTRQLQQVLTIAKDQARVWEGTTGLKIPPTSGAHAIVATPHVHDGADGCVIPIPLIQQVIAARLDISHAPSGEFQPFHEPIVHVPKGVTTLRVIAYSDAGFAQCGRLQTKNTSGTVLETEVFVRAVVKATVLDVDQQADGIITSSLINQEAYFCDITVTADSYVILSFQFPDGDVATFGASVVDAFILGYSVLPWVGAPIVVAPYLPPLLDQTDVRVPNADHYLDGSADQAPFTPVESAMTTDDHAVSSYLCSALCTNDALLAELVTGMAVSGKSNAHTSNTFWKGHNHGEDLTTYTSGMLGADIDQTLLAVSWGVGRQRPNFSSEHTSIDQVSPINDVWDGAIFGPTVYTSRSTFADVGRYRVRIPSALAANLNAGAKLKLAVYGYADVTTIGGNMEVRVTLYDSTGATGGTATTLTWSADGRAVKTGTLDYPGVGGSGVGGADHFVLVEMRKTTAVATPSTLLYSMCLWYEET